MLNHLKKLFSAQAEQPVALATSQEEVMTTQTGQTESSADNKIAELTASLSTASEALLANEQKFVALSAQFEQAQAALAVIEADKAQMIVAAQEAKQLARKEKVEATLGTAKAASVLEATATLEDAQFDAVVAAFAASYEAEAKSPMFSEQGVSAEAEVVAEKPVHFNTFINKK